MKSQCNEARGSGSMGSWLSVLVHVSFSYNTVFLSSVSTGGRAGGAVSLIQARQVRAAPKGMVLRLFGFETGIDFVHFGLKSGMVFEGTKGVYVGIHRFNFK